MRRRIGRKVVSENASIPSSARRRSTAIHPFANSVQLHFAPTAIKPILRAFNSILHLGEYSEGEQGKRERQRRKSTWRFRFGSFELFN